jgi:tetratricopeptide (TPR) repeat protein
VPAYRHLLACCYRELGLGPFSAEGQLAIELLEKLCEDFPEEPDYLLDLSEAYSDFGPPPFTAPGKSVREIEQHFRKALAASERLGAAHPNVPEYEFSQGQIRLKLGTFLRRDRRVEAEEQFRRAISIQTGLVRRFPEVAWFHVWLATCHGALAKLLAQGGKYPEAIEWLDAATEDLEKVLAVEPDRRLARATLTEAYVRLAVVCDRAGLAERAADARRRADAVRPNLRPAPDVR